MKKFTFHSSIKISFITLVFFNLTGLSIFTSCVSNDMNANKGKNNSQQNSVSKSGENANTKKFQDYLLIGVQGRAGKGAVFKCNIDGSNCFEFLGGTLKFQPPENQKQRAVKLYAGDRFGSSIFVTKDKILIGATGRDNKKATDAGSISNPNFKDDVGSVFQCNLDGSECIELFGGQIGFPKPLNSNIQAINLLSNDHLGSSLFATNDKILIGATGRDSNRDDDIGAIFQCSLDGKNCIESMGGKSKKSSINANLEKFDGFGSSIYANNSNIFIGAKNKNGGNGRVFKCNLAGEKCVILDVKNLNLVTNDSLGSSLTGNASNIYVGAFGRNGLPPTEPSLFDIGSVFKCKIDGTNCIEIVGGENKSSTTALGLTQKDYLGSSLVVSGDFLFIGAMGRKNNSGVSTGAVFRCRLDGTNCVELIAGKNKNSFSSDDISLASGDLLGSSLAIVSLPN